MKKKNFYSILIILILKTTVAFSQQRSGADATLGSSKNENGSTSISYNLYTIDNGDIKVPITLYYSGSKGIKVTEIATKVGLGWNMSAGGNITRVVQGYPDDEYKNQEKKEGILFNNNLSVIESINIHTVDNNQMTNITKKDYEPDIFYIKLPTISTIFFFDKNKEIKCLNKNIKISFTQESSGKINSFTMIDEIGIKYFFNVVSNVTETTKFERADVEPEDPSDVTHTYNSEWNLSQIIDISGNQISFTYVNENINYNVNKIEKKQIQKPGYPTVHDYDYIAFTTISQSSKILEAITSSKGDQIQFFHSGRFDIQGALKLDRLTINNKVNYDFMYDHFFNENENRLKLTNIKLNTQHFLEFIYDSKLLPKRQSMQQDFWGYYNNNNNAQTLLPKVYIDQTSTKSKSFVNYGYDNFNESNYIVLEGADRRSNMNAEACILKTIIDKWRGQKTFEYELNDFMHENKKVTGNGLRIKSIKYNDEISSYKTNYTYTINQSSQSSGSVISLPKFSYIITNNSVRYIKNSNYYMEIENTRYHITMFYIPPYPIPTIQYNNEGSANWSENERYYITTKVFSTPANNILGDFGVNYSQINETSDLYKGTKKIYFDNPVFIDELNSDIIRYSTISGTTYYGNLSTDSNAGGFPFKPSTISNKNNTFIKKEEVFDSSSNLVSSSSTNYTDLVDINNKITGLKYFVGTIPNPFFPMITSKPYNANGGYISKYNLYQYSEKRTISTANKEYLNGTQIEKVTTLEYNNRSYINKEKWTDIDGNSFENRITYSCDYTVSGSPSAGSPAEAIQYMNINNILQAPIEKVFLKNGKVISGEINIYKKIGNTVQLAEKKYLGISDLNIPHQYVSISGSSLQIDTKYITQEYYDLYDPTNGNLLQKHNENGIYTSFIYGYNARYLVATLVNVPYSSIPTNLLNSISTTVDEATLRNLFNQLKTQLPEGRIVTSTYIPSVGKRSETDEKGTSLFYEYDVYNRLEKELDTDGKIVKRYKYNSAPKKYYNVEKSKIFAKNCGSNAIGSLYLHTVPAGQYISIISQYDADQQAENNLNIDGQNTVNSNGTCTAMSCSVIKAPSLPLGIFYYGSIFINSSYPTNFRIQMGFKYDNTFNWSNGVIVGNVTGNCLSSTIRTSSTYSNGVWGITINPNGDIIIKFIPATALPPNNTSISLDFYVPIN